MSWARRRRWSAAGSRSCRRAGRSTSGPTSPAGYPLAGLLWIAAPDDVVGDAGRWLAGRAENRFCAEVLAAANLVVVLDLRLPEHLAEFVARFSAEFPAAQVVDRRAVVTLLKVHGRILDDQGRSVRTVDVDPWRGFGADARI